MLRLKINETARIYRASGYNKPKKGLTFDVKKYIIYINERRFYTMSKKISQEAKEARNAYYREWRKKNPEKVKRAQEKYWMKKVKEMQEQEEEQE